MREIKLEKLPEEQMKLLSRHKNLCWAIIYQGRSIFDTGYNKSDLDIAVQRYNEAPGNKKGELELRLISWKPCGKAVTEAKEADDDRFQAWLAAKLEERRKEQ